MIPREIRAELIRRGVRQMDIARLLGVNKSLVANVIAGRRTNGRVREAIALAVGQPVAALWPSAPGTEFTTRRRASNG